MQPKCSDGMLNRVGKPMGTTFRASMNESSSKMSSLDLPSRAKLAFAFSHREVERSGRAVALAAPVEGLRFH
jgi:hypothetical protein